MGMGARRLASEGLTKVNSSPNIFHPFIKFLFYIWGNKATVIQLICPEKNSQIIHFSALVGERGEEGDGSRRRAVERAPP